MNENEMVEEMAKIANFSAFDFTQGTIQSKTIYTAMATALYNAGYRKVGDDEIVESMKTYERARQETAREILQDLYNRYYECGGAVDVAIMLYDWISEMSKKYGIELED